jgi:HEAT repeat protein
MTTWAETVAFGVDSFSGNDQVQLRSGQTMISSYERIIALVVGMTVINGTPCLGQQPDTAQLLRSATTGSGQARYTAIDDLGELHVNAGQVLPQLRQLLANADPQVRWRSARAIGDYGALATGAAPELRKLLADKDAIVQYHAVVALGRVGDRSDETVRGLVAAVTAQDARVARAAIAALRNLKPEPQHVVEVFENALSSNDQAVTLHAMEAIIERGGDAAPLLNEALKRPKTAYVACAAIEQIGPEAAPTVPALTELLGKTRHSHLLIQALLALASIGPAAESAAPQILPLLEMPNDATVPVAAAYALGSIGAKNADEPLRRALSKDNAFLQMIAAWSLAKLHPGDEPALQMAIEKLTQGLKSQDPALRTAAAKGLQMLQPPAELVAPHLIALINDPDPEVQANIVNAAASLGESVVPRLVRGLQNPELRGTAVRVLRQLGPKAASAVQPLIEATRGADAQLRAEIHFALAAIGPAAAPATSMLAQAIGSDDQHIRESALYALRQIGPAAMGAREPLLARMKADDSFDALASAWALARIAPGDATVAAQAVPKLQRGLSADDEPTRLECAEALAAFGPAAKSAVPTLQRVAKEDAAEEVRAAAAAALERLNS